MRTVARVAWYRFRVTFKRRWAGLLAIALLVGLIGGVALGAAAAARRTQSSYPAFLASTHPSDLSVIDYTSVLRRVEHLPGVKHGESVAVLNSRPLGPNAARIAAAGAGRVLTVSSVNGLLFDQDRATAVDGRMADPTKVDETVVTVDAARLLGLRVGQVLPVGFYDSKQKLRVRLDDKIVGIVELADAVVQDDTERSLNYVIFTPALTARLRGCCYNASLAFTGLSLVHGSQDDAKVESEYEGLLPAGSSFYLRESSITVAKAERAIKPESIALGVFGLIAALAALLIAGQLIGRQLNRAAADLEVMRALGATPQMTTSDGLLGVVGALAVGALLASGLAVALSPLSPIGPVRAVYPSRGIAFDWTVLGGGVGVLVAGLGALAVALAYRAAPHRAARRARSVATRSRAASLAAASGLSPSAVTGVRFALASGRGRNSVPVRSAMLGTTLAMIVVVGTVTFGAGLRTLVSHPALYGWNWDYELGTGAGGGYISVRAAAPLLARDHDVGAWSGVYFDSLRVDSLTVPLLGGTPNSAVQPPLLSGHGFAARDQIVVGATTLAQLHKHVGDTVEASYATSRTRRSLRIVGVATMPAVGPALGLHTSMGTGVLASESFLPKDSLGTGPNALFVRMRAGVTAPAALPALRKIAAALSSSDETVSVLSVQRPAEIVNYRSMGNTPVLLGTALALGAVSALALTLLASVRRRRRDLALLKTLGFTRRQLAAVVAWQSTIAVAIGTMIGLPVGIVVGRTLWDLFAREIYAVPRPTVPGVTVALIAVGALVLANLVAAVPGRQAARTPTALLLHAE